MPQNNKKIISIMLEQSAEIEERCEGYRAEIIDVIADILNYERDHRVSGTHIQKNINDKCNATARFLVTRRNRDAAPEGLDP